MNNFFEAVSQVNRDASVYTPPAVAEWGERFEALAKRKNLPTHLECHPWYRTASKGTIWHGLDGKKYLAVDGSSDYTKWVELDE